MINSTEYNILNTLTGDLLKLYQNVKDILNKIYQKIRTTHQIDELRENFEVTTRHYYRELDKQGYEKESYLFMAICSKFSYLLDKPKILIKHKKFFKDLFTRLDYLICIKTNKPEIYEEKYKEFFNFYIKQSCYFGREIYVPEYKYNEETLSK